MTRISISTSYPSVLTKQSPCSFNPNQQAPIPNGRVTFDDHVECCNKAYAGQISKACIMDLPNPPTSAPVGFDDALYYPIWVNTGYGDVRSLVRVFGCWICSLFVSSVFMSVSSGGDSTPSVTNSITCFSNPPLLFFQNSHITLCTSLFAVLRPTVLHFSELL